MKYGSYPSDSITWRKARASQANGSCVEVARLPDRTMAARDSKHGDHSSLLRFTHEEWEYFLASVKKGKFDLT